MARTGIDRRSAAADDRSAAGAPAKPPRGVRARVRALPGGWVAWRVGVTVLGVAVIVGGIILLPLPGPGWLIIFAGLGLLATEYVWAGRLLTFARDTFTRWTVWLGQQPLWVRGAVALGTFAFVVAAIWLSWLLLH